MQGGKKGLLRQLDQPLRQEEPADVRFTGQNGKRFNYRLAVKVKCKGKARHRKHEKAAR